jgi:hypothetical protein
MAADHPLKEGERDDDAMAWAEAFCRTKRERGWSLDEIDEGLMVGWFANAIERACYARGSDAAMMKN